MNFIEKAKEAFANKQAAPAPKLSKAKAAAAAKELEQKNPSRARIEAKKAQLLAKLQSK